MVIKFIKQYKVVTVKLLLCKFNDKLNHKTKTGTTKHKRFSANV